MINNRQQQQAGRRRGRGGQQQRPQGGNGPRDNGNRIDNRARGNASQLHEKYKTLAADSQRQGDRVTTEYYLQFADHYFRVLSETRSRFEEQRRPSEDEQSEQDGDDYGDEGEIVRASDQPMAHTGNEPRRVRDGNRDQNGRDQNGRDQNARDQNGRDQRDQNGRDQNARDQNGREQNNRDQDGNRESGNRDYGNRDNRNRDYAPREARNGNRENTYRDNGAGEGGNRDYANRESVNRDAGNRDSGNRDSGNRDYGYRDAPRDGEGRDANMRDTGNREAPRDREDRRPRSPRPSMAAPREPQQADVQPAEAVVDTTPRDAAPVVVAESTQNVANDVEAPAPRRRGRPRREVAVEAEAPVGFEADRLPPSLGISAVVSNDTASTEETEAKPRRRRTRATPEASAAE